MGATRPVVILAGLGLVAVILIGAARWLMPEVMRSGFDYRATLLQEGKGALGLNDCRTSLAKTTSCVGEDTSFQECHYQFRAEGLPDARVCAAFLEGPDADASAKGATIAKPCPETSPLGWERVSCADYGLDAKMVCHRCYEESRPESMREVLQGFDRSCRHGVVLKSCNWRLPGSE